MITKTLFKLGSLMLVLLVVLSFDAVGQQRTWYVNSQIGSDGYDGLSATITPPASGPKKTINRAITEANDGDIIVVTSTGVDYALATGEPATLDPGIKKLTFQTSGGTPKVTVGFSLNNTSVATVNTQAVTFAGPIHFAAGFSLQRGAVVGASNLTLTGTILRYAYVGADPTFDAAVTYSGTVNILYESAAATSEITTGNEFLASGVSNLNVGVAGGTATAIAVTLDGVKTITGVLTTVETSTMNLGGNTLTLSGTNAHNVDGDVTNGTLAFTMTGAASVTGTVAGVDLPNISATKSTSTLATLTLATINTTKGISISGNASFTAALAGGTSSSVATVTGAVINSGAGAMSLDRSAGAVLWITGDMTLSGTGTIGFGATATGITLTGNVGVSTAFTLGSTAVTSGATITFPDLPVTVSGTVSNTVAIGGSTTVANLAFGAIIFTDAGGTANTVTLGGVTNNVAATATMGTGGSLADAGFIQFNTGAGNNVFSLGTVTNSASLGSALMTRVGRIFFSAAHGGNVTTSALTNSSTYTNSTPGNCGDVDFVNTSTGTFTATAIKSEGGKGGDIIVGNGNFSCSSITNARTEAGADITVGSAAGAATVTVSSNLTNSGKSKITFTSTQTGAVGIAKLVSTGTGTIEFPNATTSTFSFSAGVEVSAGTVDLDGAGAATGNITSGNLNLTGGTIALGTGVRSWAVSGSNNFIGGASGNPTFTGGASTTLNLSLPVPTILQTVAFGPVEPSWPGDFTITNNGGLAEATRLTGGNFRVGGTVTFNTGSTSSMINLDGCKLYVMGAAFTNTSGYVTANNGYVSMKGTTANQNVGGAGDFGDFEVNTGTGTTSYSAVFQVGIGTFKGNFYLTTGTADNLAVANIAIGNSTATPTVIRNEGTFAQAPTYSTPVNVTYIGRDKTSSFELPTGSTNLMNLMVATTNGGNGAGTNVYGKGAPARGVVTVAGTSPTVNGKIIVSQYQTLAIGTTQSFTMKGAEMQIDGQIVNLDLANFGASQNIVILAATAGTTIKGTGLLPPMLVQSVGNMIDGSVGVIDQQLGANFTVELTGGDDVIDDTPLAANGEIRFDNVAAALTVKMGTGAGLNGTHIGVFTTANSGNTLTLGANLSVAGNMAHAAGQVNVASFTLTLRGTAPAITGGATMVGTGLLKFQNTGLTTLTVNTADATIAVNTEVVSSSGNLVLAAGGFNLTFGGTLTVSGTTGGNGIDIGAGRTLTAAGSSVTMASGTAFLATSGGTTGILKLNATTPPLTFNASGAVTIQNLTVSNDVVLALTGTSPSMTVNGTFLHDGGKLNFGAFNLTIAATGTYRKTGTTSAYEATSGYLVITTATFNQGANAFDIPNLRFDNTTATTQASLASQTGVVTVTGKLDLRTTGQVVDIQNANTGDAVILKVGDGATVNYRAGAFDVAPTFVATIILVADQMTSGTTIDATVWPSSPATLVTTLRMANAASVDASLLPGNRTVNSTLDLRVGILNLNGKTLTIADNGTIRRRHGGSVSVATAGSAFAFGNNISVIYEPGAASVTGDFTSGAELPTTLKDITVTRSANVANAVTTINSAVTINGNLTVRNNFASTVLAAITILGNVTVESEVATYSNATPPTFNMLSPITFSGTADQTITVPSTGAAIGSMTVNKPSGKLTVMGGDVTCTGTLTLTSGLVYTGATNSLILGGNTAGSVLTGFVRNVSGSAKSHVVGNVAVPLKTGNIVAFGRNEFPVGDATYYRPAAITIVNPGALSGMIGITASIKYDNTRPTGIVGLPIFNGVSQGVDIARYPDFSWFIKTTGSLGQTLFNLELTAEGYTDFDDIANVRMIRRSGTLADVSNTWSMQGAQYDNYVIAGIPTVVNVNSTGGLIPGGAIYTYGLKSTMVVANGITDIKLTDAAKTFTRNLTNPALFTGAKGAITYSVTVDNPAVATATIASNVLTVTQKVSGTTFITIIGTDAFDGSRISYKVNVQCVSDVEVASNAVPTEFSLSQNYPNPFNPSTTIRFGLPKEAPVTIEIYNLLGMKVRTLISGQTMNAAFYNVVWDGKDEAGVNLPSGIYIYRIVADKFVASKKMTLVK